ncbi:hypothetical protein STEG23_023787 [Scotinomys teguina]
MDHRHPHGLWHQVTMGHGPQHDLQWQYRPCTLTHLLVATHDMHVNMAPYGSMAHRHQYGFRWQHRTSMWPPVVPWTTNIMNKAPGCSNTVDTFSSRMYHRYQHSFSQQHGPWALTLSMAMDINMASSSSTDHGHPPGLWW